MQPGTPTPVSTVTANSPDSPTPGSTVTPVSETAPLSTATATPPPAPHVNVESPPYAASECSDKYPCNDDVAAWEERIRVPPGFEATYFAAIEDFPTSITFGPDGALYAAAMSGTIYSIDTDGRVSQFFEGLMAPTGLAFHPTSGALYVSSRIDPASAGGEAQVGYIQNGELTQIIAGLPCCYVSMHGPNGIAFGPDGFGYVGVGGRADHGEVLVGATAGEQDARHPLEASILRFSPDGSSVEAYASGFRNPYDIAWDADGRLFATDNGRDGDRTTGDNPPDEFHLVVPGGEHGYPWYDCPVCFAAPEQLEVIPPLFELIPHGAAAGVTVYLHNQFPGYYNNIFLVLWSAFEGAQKVMRFGPGGLENSDFATGFAAPIDIVVGPDGSLYVADFATGIIFRISYTGL
jgi:glucose/arabinose dehydrogenase